MRRAARRMTPNKEDALDDACWGVARRGAGGEQQNNKRRAEWRVVCSARGWRIFSANDAREDGEFLLRLCVNWGIGRWWMALSPDTAARIRMGVANQASGGAKKTSKVTTTRSLSMAFLTAWVWAGWLLWPFRAPRRGGPCAAGGCTGSACACARVRV